MVRSRRFAAALILLVAMVLGTGTVAADKGDHARKILDTRLAGIPVAGQVLLGVPGGGRPWTLEEGRARLFSDGRIDLEVEGLLLGPGGSNEGTNPVATGRAIVVCNGNAVPATDKVRSGTVPFSPTGDAHVRTTLTLPSPCLAPVIFFASPGGAWFAVSG